MAFERPQGYRAVRQSGCLPFNPKKINFFVRKGIILELTYLNEALGPTKVQNLIDKNGYQTQLCQ